MNKKIFVIAAILLCTTIFGLSAQSYEAEGNYEGAVKYYTQYLALTDQ